MKLNISLLFRIFDKQGRHIGGESFGLDLNDLLFMEFFNDKDRFVSVHWIENQDLEETRMWIRTQSDKDKKSKQVLVHNSVLLKSFENG